MKYCTISGVTRYSAGTLVLGRGMSFDDDHPLVRERPGIFTDEEPGATHRAPVGPTERTAPETPRIERATRAPGEVRRGPGRPRKVQPDTDGGQE